MAKYTFQIPYLDKIVPDQTLFISHTLWLTKEERNCLHKGASIQVKGTSVPVWIVNNKKDNIEKEVSCLYEIKVVDFSYEKKISSIDNGYLVHLYPQEISKLNNKTNGLEFIALAHNDVMELNNKVYAVVHQMTISAKELLDFVKDN